MHLFLPGISHDVYNVTEISIPLHNVRQWLGLITQIMLRRRSLQLQDTSAHKGRPFRLKVDVRESEGKNHFPAR